jgi:hypothetical protein
VPHYVSRPSATPPSGVLELSAALVDYWQRRDRPDKAVQWLLPALRKTKTVGDPALRARALGKVFWPLWDSNRTDVAARRFKPSWVGPTKRS